MKITTTEGLSYIKYTDSGQGAFLDISVESSECINILIDYEKSAISRALRERKVSETNVRRENCFSRPKRRMSLAFREIGRFSRALAQNLFFKVILREYSQSKRLLTFLPFMLRPI